MHTNSTWNAGRDSKQSRDLSQWSHTIKQRGIMSKAQPSITPLLDSRSMKGTLQGCALGTSDTGGKDGLMSAGKWANPADTQTLIYSYREECKWHIKGKKNSHLDMFAVRISCPRIWYSSWETDPWGQGFPKNVMDRAWCWWKWKEELGFMLLLCVQEYPISAFRWAGRGERWKHQHQICLWLHHRSCRRALQRRVAAG